VKRPLRALTCEHLKLPFPPWLIQGDDNRNVPFQQTSDLVEKLRAQSVAFDELIVSDEIHDLLRRSDSIRSYKAMADFFDRKLAATPQPQ